MELIIVSGLSGSGKSTCLNILEDMGHHCIDNMPIEFLDNLINSLNGYKKIAIGIDIRTILFNDNSPNVSNLFKIIENIKNNNNIKLKFIYITANIEIISKRFNSTKRRHPLIDLTNQIRSLNDALKLEQELLDPLASIADLVIDTSQMSPYDLQRYLFNHSKHTKQTHVFIQSFGFKHGLPTNSDYIFDVRFIPNPYWNEELRKLSGKDKKIVEFLQKQNITQTTLNNFVEFIKFIYTQNDNINKPYINIAIGCTGGQHRSVYFVEAISNMLSNNKIQSNKFHRDLIN